VPNRIGTQPLHLHFFVEFICTDSLAQVPTMDEVEISLAKYGNGQDAVFIKEVDPRDGPFFRGGEYMLTPGDGRDAV